MTDAAIDDLLAPSALPAGHDPLADGILMAHQRAWLEDQSDLKLAEKGRRTGITYAEALDDTLIAASARSAGAPAARCAAPRCTTRVPWTWSR